MLPLQQHRKPSPQPPIRQGLYDPYFEHDACGTGFIAHIKGQKSHAIVRQALTALENMNHRGAAGSEPNTGDGAGILLQTPHRFLALVCQEVNIDLPQPGQYGVGMVFLPPDDEQRLICEEHFANIVQAEGQTVLGWRTVPTDNRTLGATAIASQPAIRQVFIGRSQDIADDMAFERKLYVIRKLAENGIRHNPAIQASHYFYVASLSYKTIVYKGMLLAEQVDQFYPDLSHPELVSAIALIHSRFSTNTFPSWERAHPNRYINHNGEINTIRGNVNWMLAREATLQSDLFGEDLRRILPVIDSEGSDSAMFDNALEFLTLAGRPLPLVMMMMIPEPWSKHETMDEQKKAFYEYYSALMEPWDGPASIAFTDGSMVGAVLDRNGLRPSRYYVTKDDWVVMASEVGVLDIPPERVLQKGRLQPGKMFLVDTIQGRIISDDELKSEMAGEFPYKDWLDRNMVQLADLPLPPVEPQPSQYTTSRRQQAFGYTFEDLRMILAPMAENGVEPLGSMGDDTPLAALSNKSQLLYNYFRQLFAQVTNPPIDAIREEIITGTEILLGSESNLLDTTPEDAHQIKVPTPIISNDDIARLRHITLPGFQSLTVPILYPVKEGQEGLIRVMDKLCMQVSSAVAQGVNLIILSDRGIDRQHAAIPALLATSGLHHHLIREGTRTRVSLIVETGEAREVHHFAVLLGYGASAVNPYLALETITDMIRRGLLTGVTKHAAVEKYIKASVKGVVKVLSKMGISTVHSYRGAQIFEALGLSSAVIDTYFCGTPTRIEGADLDVIADEVRIRHESAFPERPANGLTLDVGGRFQFREGGEYHLFNPETIQKLQIATRSNDYDLYKAYAQAVNHHDHEFATLRGLLELEFDENEAVPLDEVESVESIMTRFKTGAMSYGSISQEAHEALAIAMNRIGGKSNTGEGGEDPARFVDSANGDSRNSKIKQVASGRFGVTSHYLANAEEIQIKMAQGAKPGEGGQLPGRKVYPWIARVRYSTPGVGLISPPPHHDIYSIEDLAQLIYDLKSANPKARINVKLVSEVGVGTIAAGVAKGHADVILISGHDGGTGASPQSSIKHAGLPWELGVAETHQTLLLNGLRSRVRIETDGQLKTGRDVVIAALLGAEEYGFATAPLVTLGCIMMRVCQKNTCPVGVATQDPELRKRFMGKPEYVVNFLRFVAQDAREMMAKLGFRSIDEMIGRVDKLQSRRASEHWKARGIDLSNILHQVETPPGESRFQNTAQDHGLEQRFDKRVLLDLCHPALDVGEKIEATLPIRNTDRAVGTMVGSEISRRYGAQGLPDSTIKIHFHGSAGQSFGAFLPNGMTFYLDGDTNDYLGKGLSGGKIIVRPPEGSTFVPSDNIITGNVAFYGATGGEAYIRGLAGERFCVRNSGVYAVVEGVGDHGCEYMTGGCVVVLGQTGRNFAAGMSGGIAYVLDEEGDFHKRCNQQMVDLEPLSEAHDIRELNDLIWQHAFHTGSKVAWRILGKWQEMWPRFVKVFPKDYKRMLEQINKAEEDGFNGEEAIMIAFEANAHDLARISGN
ncbi:MAG: glutamate synthase large subunit [Candidatus Promineifilaceae bacterium]|nr:glutamate synthase large subunit [Candidatus Promineifilaceae bacterium]